MLFEPGGYENELGVEDDPGKVGDDPGKLKKLLFYRRRPKIKGSD